mmetsp:Transcript_9438/g.16917  ORF Transcript_9438/g.16917 Transcript_9438/m.16917 type:complete len:1531 (-) Transcript_9438:56-4648(-)
MSSFRSSGSAFGMGSAPISRRAFKPSSGFFSGSAGGARAGAFSTAAPTKGPRRARSSATFEDDFSIGSIGRSVSAVASSSGVPPQSSTKKFPLEASLPDRGISVEASAASSSRSGSARVPSQTKPSGSQPGGSLEAQSAKQAPTEAQHKAAQVASAFDEEEDVFGFGGGMDDDDGPFRPPPAAAKPPMPPPAFAPDEDEATESAPRATTSSLPDAPPPQTPQPASLGPAQSSEPPEAPQAAAHAPASKSARLQAAAGSKPEDARPAPQPAPMLPKLIEAAERHLPSLKRERQAALPSAAVPEAGEAPAAERPARKRAAETAEGPCKKLRGRGSQESQVLEPGVTVFIHDLAGMASLNGKTARCEKWLKEKGRWAVVMEDSGHEIHLKPANLSLSAQVEDESFQASVPVVPQEEGKVLDSGQEAPVEKTMVKARQAKKRIIEEVNKEKARQSRLQQTKKAVPKAKAKVKQTRKAASAKADAGKARAGMSAEKAARVAALEPFGANYVTQDLKRKGRSFAAKGRSKQSVASARYFGSNGRLKPKYARAADAEGSGPRWSMGSAKAQRFRYQQQQAVAQRCLATARDAQSVTSVFSSGMTPELLSELAASSEQDLGDIALTRPPDAVDPEHAKGKPPMADELPKQSEAQEELASTTEVLESPPPLLSKKLVNTDDEPNSAIDPHPAAEFDETAALSDSGGALQAPASEAVDSHISAVWRENPEDYSADDLKEILRRNFHYEEFRPGQQEAVSSLLAGKKTLLLLSTGSGKSLCFQMPAFLLREEGFTLVISPLVSLMQDQLQRLPHCLRGALISSHQSREQSRSVLRAVRARLIDVLFISPERLSMWAFDGVGLPPIALACVDEAHCVSEWSHDFRPDFLRLHEFLIESLGARRLMALTATATRPTIRSVCSILKLDVIVRADRSFVLQEMLDEPSQPRVQRMNLTMNVQCVADEDVQFHELVKLLQAPEHAKKSVVIYVWRKFSADQISKRLRTIVRGGVSAYHGGMLPDARRKVQDAFMVGITRTVVATMAFGMGIDKPDIRMVVHYNIPRSMENYIQETGRCSRDGLPGSCLALLNARDYKSMRWMASGSGGSSRQSGTIRRLLASLLDTGDDAKFLKRHVLGKEALLDLEERGMLSPAVTSWQPYSVAFEERDMAKHLNCELDELHSVLAQFAYRAKSHVMLYSKFPTKMKLRFFNTDPAELVKIDPLLRDVLAIAKERGGVHTIETAHALAAIGGRPSQLSNGLWNAQGDEFSIEKADYGYMVAVLQPADEQLKDDWVETICNVNVQARQSKVEKLDAVYMALMQAAEAPASTTSTPPTADAGEASDADAAAQRPAADEILSGLIDAYFAATANPSTVVAGDHNTRSRLLSNALGADYHALRPPTPSFSTAPGRSIGSFSQSAGSKRAASSGPQSGDRREWEVYDAAEDRRRGERDAVYSVVVRLVMGADWPDVSSEDPDSVAHLVAQFLAGIGSQMMPAKKWSSHRCWGRFKEFSDFDELADLVSNALARVRNLQAARKAAMSTGAS